MARSDIPEILSPKPASVRPESSFSGHPLGSVFAPPEVPRLSIRRIDFRLKVSIFIQVDCR
jgi:hypothetical protein